VGGTQRWAQVLLAIDCTDAVIDEAVRLQADLVVAYHPILFAPLKRIVGVRRGAQTLLLPSVIDSLGEPLPRADYHAGAGCCARTA
jgi:putative NIF3 family GTP cyclohydrolase 1 type 2